MARLIVLVGRPYHLKPEEAETWLRQEASALRRVDGVARIALYPLGNPAPDWSGEWGWLIELECEDDESAARAVRDETWSLLLGDLRLLGMRPLVAAVGNVCELGG